MEFSRQEYWSGLPFPLPGDLPDPGIEPTSLALPAWAGKFFITSASREVSLCDICDNNRSKVAFLYIFFPNVCFPEASPKGTVLERVTVIQHHILFFISLLPSILFLPQILKWQEKSLPGPCNVRAIHTIYGFNYKSSYNRKTITARGIVLQSVIFKTNCTKLFSWPLWCWILLTEDIFMWKSPAKIFLDTAVIQPIILLKSQESIKVQLNNHFLACL